MNGKFNFNGRDEKRLGAGLLIELAVALALLFALGEMSDDDDDDLFDSRR